LLIPRSLEFGFDSKGKILLGTLGSEIFEIEFIKNILEGPLKIKPLVYSHFSISNNENNKINALTFWAKKNMFISISEDITIRIWDLEKNKQIDYLKLDVDNKGNKYKSEKGNNNKPTCMHLHKDENDLAIGFIDGAVRVNKKFNNSILSIYFLYIYIKKIIFNLLFSIYF
jgi:WD40 repeat protein